MPADLINQNMCMPTLLAVIDRIEYYIMSTSKMEVLTLLCYPKYWGFMIFCEWQEPPLWMVQLLKKMSVDTHIVFAHFIV
jgi:hypothetical protein